jgi:hypothetical protein
MVAVACCKDEYMIIKSQFCTRNIANMCGEQRVLAHEMGSFISARYVGRITVLYRLNTVSSRRTGSKLNYGREQL